MSHDSCYATKWVKVIEVVMQLSSWEIQFGKRLLRRDPGIFIDLARQGCMAVGRGDRQSLSTDLAQHGCEPPGREKQ